MNALIVPLRTESDMAKTIKGINKKIAALAVGERLVLPRIDEEVYHATDGIGSTLMKAACTSMAHYKAQRDHQKVYTPATQTAFTVGHAAHCLVLEPELYDKKFVIMPSTIKRKAGKDWENFKAANHNKDILTMEQDGEVGAMADSVLDQCGRFFTDGDPELSVWYKHESGLILKARVDYQLGDALIDLKTTRHETAHKFNQSVKYDYAIQDAHYRLATGLADMIFVGVGKSAPYSAFLCK